MTQATLSKTPRVTSRALMGSGVARGGIVRYEIKSQAGSSHYHVAVDITSGAVTCTCPGFVHHYASRFPKLWDQACHCKHIRTHLASIVRDAAENHGLVGPRPSKYVADESEDVFATNAGMPR